MSTETAEPIESRPPRMVWIMLVVFLPFSGGYFLSYLFRSMNAVIAPQLIAEIDLSAGDLGLLTAAYFLAFAAFQLPLGMLLDRFGPRRVQACLLLSAALGALVFSIGESREVLAAGRALIGLGVAGGLMASLKAINLWFPPARWPLVNGCFLGIGGLGAIAATAPVEYLLQYTDWRNIFVGLSVATICVSAIIFLVVPEREPGGGSGVRAAPLGEQLRGIVRVYGDRLFWRLAPISVTGAAANLAIQGLWAGPWFKDVAGFDRPGVADSLFILAAAMTVGFVVGGIIADLLGRLGVSLMAVIGWGMALFLATQAVITFELAPTAIWPWIVFGLVSNAMVFAFPLLNRHCPQELGGRANTALNVLIFAGVFLAQAAIGWIIDIFPVGPDGGFLPESYRAAFGAVLLVQLVGFAWFLIPAKKGAST